MSEPFYSECNCVYEDIGDPAQVLMCICPDQTQAKLIAEALNHKRAAELEPDRLACPLYSDLQKDVVSELLGDCANGHETTFKQFLTHVPVDMLIKYLPDHLQKKYEELKLIVMTVPKGLIEETDPEPKPFSGQCERGVPIGRSCPDCKRIQL